MQTTDIAAPPPAKVTSLLIHGDCLEVMPDMKSFSIDACFADLPFSCTANTWDTSIDLPQFWRVIKKVSKPQATVVCNATQPFTTHLALSNIESFKYDLVWQKNTRTGFLNAKKAPLRAHESLLVFAAGPNIYNPQKTYGHTPARRTSKTTRECSNWGVIAKTRNSDDSRYPISILEFSRDDMRGRQGHPTQKPVALLEWLIKTYTNPGDTVLDPVSGSATTAIAALRTGRNVICIEKDRTYFEAGVKRVRDEVAASGLNAEVVVHG